MCSSSENMVCQSRTGHTHALNEENSTHILFILDCSPQPHFQLVVHLTIKDHPTSAAQSPISNLQSPIPNLQSPISNTPHVSLLLPITAIIHHTSIFSSIM